MNAGIKAGAKAPKGKPQQPRDAKLEVLFSTAEHQILTAAAALEGIPVADFVRKHLLPLAQSLVDARNRQQQSEQDRLRLVDLVQNPPSPVKPDA